MKKFILTALLFCPLDAQAYVFTEIPVDYTGNVAERFDITNNYMAGSTGGYIGGPAANNSLGGAFQFTVDHTQHVDYLLADARIRSDYGVPEGTIGSFDFQFKLYTGTINDDRWGIIPDINSLAQSVNMHVETSTYTVYDPDLGITHTFNQDGYYDDVPLRFDVKLKEGTYWIARERDYGQSGPIVDNIDVRFARVHNPEPATLLLVGGGLAAAWRMKRRAKTA